MVIGNGLIAKAFAEFRHDDNYLFFCSGVSNSLCRDKEAFDREVNLVKQSIRENQNKKFLYFSTTSIEDPSMTESLYVQHKLAIEQIISSSCPDYCIFRLSNVVGNSSNKYTVLNFLFNSLNNGQEFELWNNSNRNLIDVDDVVAIIKELLAEKICHNKIINIANSNSYPVPEIVAVIEQYLSKKGKYVAVEKGMSYAVNTDYIKSIINKLDIKFEHDYILKLLCKYYSI
jgi:nucleoside-diphosphate-sugar epimerase